MRYLLNTPFNKQMAKGLNIGLSLEIIAYFDEEVYN